MGKKGKKGKKEPKIVDGLKPSEMSRPQLLGFIQRMQAEVEKEREERNYYMLEREKIFQMWNLLMEQIKLEKEKAALFNSHMQNVEKMKEGEDDLYESKLRFLKQEHSRRLGQVRLHHLTLMKHIQDENWAVQIVMREALMGKKKEIRQAQLAFYQMIRGQYWKHAKDVSDLRKEFAREIRRLETSFDRRLFENNDKRQEEQTKAVTLLANDKEHQIHNLIESHRIQAKALQTFFRDLIRHNLGLIYGMKDAAKKEKTLEVRARKDYQDFKAKYENYVASALQWKKDMEAWEIEHSEDDLDALLEELADKTDECKDLKHSLRMLECSNETLHQRIALASKEKDSLRKEFARSFVQLQKRTAMSRFCAQVKAKAAKREGELYQSLTDDVEKGPEDKTNYFESLMSSRKREMWNIKADINDHATEHRNVEENYKEVFTKNEIHLADIGFPIKSTGVEPQKNDEDLLASATESEKDRASRTLSKRHRSTSARNKHSSRISVGISRSRSRPKITEVKDEEKSQD